VRKFRWLLVIAILVICLMLWTQMLNVMCDQDVQFFSGMVAAFLLRIIPFLNVSGKIARQH